MEQRTRLIIWGLCSVIGLGVEGWRLLALILAVLLGGAVEVLLVLYHHNREVETMASRRKCMFFVERWHPDNPVELGVQFDGMFMCGHAKKLQSMKKKWVAAHTKAGNGCIGLPLVDDGNGNQVSHPMEMPIIIEYARYGERVMENQDSYYEYLRQRIIEEETRFHVGLASKPDNYHEDYVLLGKHER